MKLQLLSFLLAFDLSVLLISCGPAPVSSRTVPTPKTIQSPKTSSPPTGSSTPISNPESVTAPVPSNNSPQEPSTPMNLPDGSQLRISLANRFFTQAGQRAQLQVSLVDSQGQPLPINSQLLRFVSSCPQDFSVDANGMVTALVDQGFSEISVQLEKTALKATLLVSVNAVYYASGGSGGGSGGGGQSIPSEAISLDVEFEGLGE